MDSVNPDNALVTAPRLPAVSTLLIAAALVAGVVVPFNLEEYSELAARMHLPGTLQSYLIVFAFFTAVVEGASSFLLSATRYFLPLFLAVIISVAFSSYGPELQSLRAVVLSIAFGALVAWNCRDERVIRWIWTPFVLVAVFAALLGIVQAFTGTSYIVDAMHGDYLGKYGLDRKVAFGFTYSSVKMGLTAIIAAGCIMSGLFGGMASSRSRLVVQAALIFPLVFASILTASRSIWVAIIIMAIVFLAFRRIKEGLVLLGACGATFLLLGVLSTAPPERQFSATHGTQDNAPDITGTVDAGGPEFMLPQLDERSSFAGGGLRYQSLQELMEGNTQAALDLLKSEDSFLSRMSMFGLAWRVFQSAPATGVGFNRFPDKGRDLLAESGQMGLLAPNQSESDPMFKIKLDLATLLTYGPRKAGLSINNWTVPALAQALAARNPAQGSVQIGRLLIDPDVKALSRELEGPNTHNMYLSIIAELGVVGVLAFVGTVLYVAYSAFRVYMRAEAIQRRAIEGGVAVAVAMLAVAFFWHIQLQKELWVVFGMVVGLVLKPWGRTVGAAVTLSGVSRADQGANAHVAATDKCDLRLES